MLERIEEYAFDETGVKKKIRNPRNVKVIGK
jgi:hypothetical protein